MSPRRITLPITPLLSRSMVSAAGVQLRRSKMPTTTQATRCFSGLLLLTKYSIGFVGRRGWVHRDKS